MNSSDVLFEVHGLLGIITLNRPKSLNALTRTMVESISNQLHEWEDDDEVAQVLIRGAGDRGLCAGGDMASVYEELQAFQQEDNASLLPEEAPDFEKRLAIEEFFSIEYSMNMAIANYPKPYIALMDGVVLGGGIGVSAHGSHRIVTERSRIGMPETTIGLSPDVGGTYLLARAPEQMGLYAGTTGKHFGASGGIHLGLADVFVRSDLLDQLTQELTTKPIELVLPNYTQQLEPSALHNASWINEAYAHHNVLDVLGALDELATSIREAGETAELLRSKSPTMVEVAFQAIRRARDMTLEESLAQEYAITLHALHSADLREGIRAQLIDKDRNPKWSPMKLEYVDKELVRSYFSQVPGRTLLLR